MPIMQVASTELCSTHGTTICTGVQKISAVHPLAMSAAASGLRINARKRGCVVIDVSVCCRLGLAGRAQTSSAAGAMLSTNLQFAQIRALCARPLRA